MAYQVQTRSTPGIPNWVIASPPFSTPDKAKRYIDQELADPTSQLGRWPERRIEKVPFDPWGDVMVRPEIDVGKARRP
jgi:hypothetical protein